MDKVVVMVGPSLQSRGGIASVVCAYQSAGLFNKWPIVYLSSHVEGSKAKKLLAAVAALTSFGKLLLLRRVTALHIHVARDTSFWRKSIFILFAYAARRPVFVHIHSGGFPDFYWKNCGNIKKRVVRFILDRADRIIVLSSQWLALLDGVTVNKRIVKIPNFIIEEQSEPVKGEPDNNSVLFLGRLSAEKGFFDLLEAAALVRQRFSEFRLRCGGEGDDIADVQMRIKKLGIESNVELLGWVGEQERQNHFNRAAVFILPSYVEGLPMAVIEAMSKGVPVVASNVGGVPDVIEDGIDGMLVHPGDVRGITDALVKLFTDPALRVRLGKEGKNKVARQFTSVTILPFLERIYREFGAKPNA